MTQPCKICRGTGTVECPAQTCSHWCPCTVCNGTGKVEVYEDWSQGFAEEKVRAVIRITPKQLDRLGELAQKINDLSAGDRQYPRTKEINNYAVEMENIVKKAMNPKEKAE